MLFFLAKYLLYLNKLLFNEIYKQGRVGRSDGATASHGGHSSLSLIHIVYKFNRFMRLLQLFAQTLVMVKYPNAKKYKKRCLIEILKDPFDGMRKIFIRLDYYYFRTINLSLLPNFKFLTLSVLKIQAIDKPDRWTTTRVPFLPFWYGTLKLTFFLNIKTIVIYMPYRSNIWQFVLSIFFGPFCTCIYTAWIKKKNFNKRKIYSSLLQMYNRLNIIIFF